MANRSEPSRRAFSLIEATASLALIAILGLIVVQAMVWSLLEQKRLQAQQAALELAANVLEAGRAQPWDQLDQDWAASQFLPSEMKELLPGGTLSVTLEPEKKLRHSRHLSVEVQWRFEPHLPVQKVRLQSLLSARTAKKPGGKS